MVLCCLARIKRVRGILNDISMQMKKYLKVVNNVKLNIKIFLNKQIYLFNINYPFYGNLLKKSSIPIGVFYCIHEFK